MNEQKERLEKELKFLEESLAAGVITNDEYEDGKKRISEKIKEIEESIDQPEEKIEIKEIKEEPEKFIEESEAEDKEEEIKHPLAIEEDEKEESHEPKEEEAETKEEIAVVKEEAPEVKTDEDSIVLNKKALYAVVIIILVIVAFFLVRGCRREGKEEEFTAVCSSDIDCKEQGKVGICQDPGTKEADCLFKDAVEVDLTIINDKNCASCDTSRMKQVLKQLFPGVKTNEIDYNSVSGKKLADKFDIDALPAYIFGAELNQTYYFFNKTERTFVKKDDIYVMLPTATGANYFFRRKEVPGKLDLFILKDEENKNENNIADVLELFGDNIDFEIYEITDEEEIKNELAITTTPVFLVNNQLKFGGIQSANAIKEKFCELNILEECSATLFQDIK